MESKPTNSKVNRRKVSWDEIFTKLETFTDWVFDCYRSRGYILKIYGIPKNGMILTAFLQPHFKFLKVTHLIEEADIILDDIIASGRTREKYKKMFPEKPFYALYDVSEKPEWLEFPWEEGETDTEDLIVRQIEYIGEDPLRKGLIDTPRRVVTMWDEIYSGYNQEVNLTTFELADVNEMIILKGIDFYSVCEHHLLPFFGKVAIGYLPQGGLVVGVSKLIRLIEKYSKRLQIQERMTMQIATVLMDVLKPLGVGVVVEAQHLCMMMRGVQSQNSVLTTNTMLGLFGSERGVKEEFFGRIK